MTVAVLTNPFAGKARYRGMLPVLLERLGTGGHAVRLLDTDTVEDAQAACHASIADGANALVAAGGDGTVHIALQALADTHVPLGILPVGTGNDFAAALGIPAQPLSAASAIGDALRGNVSRRVDLARVTEPSGAQRWYGAVLAAGFDAIVNERANRMHWPRGDRRYDLAILIELARLRPRSYVLRLDGVPHQLDAVLVAVGNTPSYGGGMRICPAADPTDGLLDVVVAGPVSRTTFVRIKPRVYAGTHVEHPMVSSYRASTVEIELSGETEGITTYADGERVLPLPISVTCVPGALSVLC